MESKKSKVSIYKTMLNSIVHFFKLVYIGFKEIILFIFRYIYLIIKYNIVAVCALINFLVINPINFILKVIGIANVSIRSKTEFTKEIKENVAITKKNLTIAEKKKIASEKRKNSKKINIENKKELKNKLERSRKLLQEELASKNNKKSDNKVTYKYICADKDGYIIKGFFRGFSKIDVNSYLVNEGYDVFSIETSKWIEFLYGNTSYTNKKLKNNDIIFWLTQLVTYLKSSIPLTDAMKILAKQMKGRKRKLFDSIVYELTMGETFSNALEKQGKAIPPILINMLKAAEATGELEETLDDMASYYTEIDSTRKEMKSAMTYPTIITVFALGVVCFILLYVIPKFITVYDTAGIEVTGMTAVIIQISNFLKSNAIYLAFGLVGFAVLFIFLFKKVKSFRKTFQTLFMHLPVIGNIMIYNEIAIFTKTFASLLRNNVMITESIGILSKVTQNEIYKEIMFNTISNITKGEKISEAFKDNWAIPEVAYYMIVTGESTGELAQMMGTVSRYFQEQHKLAINKMKDYIEPIMIISLAAIVGVIILAVILPMFDLYSNLT